MTLEFLISSPLGRGMPRIFFHLTVFFSSLLALSLDFSSPSSLSLSLSLSFLFRFLVIVKNFAKEEEAKEKKSEFSMHSVDVDEIHECLLTKHGLQCYYNTI